MPFTLRGLKFYDTGNLNSFNSTERKLINNVKKLFFLRDDYQIKKMSVCLYKTDKNKDIELRNDLIKVQQLLAYIYSSPHPVFLSPFLKFESSTFYHVTCHKIPFYHIEQTFNVTNKNGRKKRIPGSELIEGYEISINSETSIYATEGCRVYPPCPIILNMAQDVFYELDRFISTNQLFNSLCKKSNDRFFIEERIFNALRWFNKSNSDLIDENESILKLAIAFEALLDLPSGNKVTERLKDAVKLLVGPVSNLDEWINQFYEARSEIVHSGFTRDVKMKFENQTYRSLKDYGNVIFRICLNAIISGSEATKRASLSSLFKSNNKRFNEINRILDNEEDWIKNVEQEIFDLERNKFVEEEELDLKSMFGAIKRYSQKIINQKEDFETPKVIENLLDNFIKIPGSGSDLDKLELIKQIDDYLKENINLLTSYSEQWRSFKLLVETIWGYTFRNYFYLKNKQKGNLK